MFSIHATSTICIMAVSTVAIAYYYYNKKTE